MSPQLAIKDHIRESHLFNGRAALALVGIGAIIVAIVIRLVYLQILSHEHFTTLSHNNRVSIVPIEPTRGLIYDRHGIVLAQNLPAFSLEIIPEQVEDMEATLSSVLELIAISDDELNRFHDRLQQKRRFQSVPLRFRLTDEEVARFAVNRHRFPGVDIQARLVRDYPQANLSVHALGYVGRISEEELQRIDPSNYAATTHIGKLGVEQAYEDILHGTVGHRQVETSAIGRVVRVLTDAADTG